jgi:hypothetical protein
MDWESKLAGWVGKLVDIRIEDQLGLDPLAPPKLITLNRVQLIDNNRVLALYINEFQFLSVPLFAETHTKLDGNTFESVDEQAKLIYKAILL